MAGVQSRPRGCQTIHTATVPRRAFWPVAKVAWTPHLATDYDLAPRTTQAPWGIYGIHFHLQLAACRVRRDQGASQERSAVLAARHAESTVATFGTVRRREYLNSVRSPQGAAASHAMILAAPSATVRSPEPDRAPKMRCLNHPERTSQLCSKRTFELCAYRRTSRNEHYDNFACRVRRCGFKCLRIASSVASHKSNQPPMAPPPPLPLDGGDVGGGGAGVGGGAAAS